MLASKRLNGKRKDIIVQEKMKIFFFLYIINLGTIMDSSDKLNRTLKAQS